MKPILTLIMGALLLKSAMAQSYEVTPYIELERAIEALSNHSNVGIDITLPHDFSVNFVVNTLDEGRDLRFERDSSELNFAVEVTDNVSAYIDNKLARNWKHEETTVGIDIAFEFGKKLTPYVELERDLDSRVNLSNIGVEVELWRAVLVDFVINTLDEGSEVRFERESTELSFSKDFTKNVSVYLENEFGRKWQREETTLGVKINF